MACPQILSAHSLAKMFVEHIYHLHGAPECIISDQSIQFSPSFWQEFLKLLGTSQGLISSHHPQTNGSCERNNDVLEQYLCCYVKYQQDNWAELLPFAEVAYNVNAASM